MLPLQGAWVQLLVWGLRSRMPHGMTETTTTSKLIIFGGKTFGKVWGHEGRVPMNGISALIKEIQRATPSTM